MSVKSLEELLRPEALEVEVGGNLPFRLAPAETAWFLAAGKVEVFAVRLGEDGSEGPRTHLLTARAGQMIFGTPPSAPGGAGGMALLAVGLPGTRLLQLAVPRLRQLARDPAVAADLATRIEGWIQGLASQIPRASPPQVFAELRPGAETRIETPGTAARSNQGVVWVRHVLGDSCFLGAPELALAPEEYLLPLAERTWLVSTSPLELSAVDTRILLRGGGLWEGLDRYHELFLRLVGLEVARATEEERTRLGRKDVRDRGTVAAAHGRLAAVLGEDLHVPLPPEEQEAPLLVACRWVGRAQGIDLHLDTAGGEGQRGRLLDRICAASRVRFRRVILREDWWRRDNGPLLAFRLLDEKGESRRAVALLPTSRTSYEMVDPADPLEATRRPVNAALAERLAGEAYMFYPPFPERPLKLRDLLQMMLRNRRDDLATLLLMGIAGGVLGLLVPLATGAIFGSIIPSSNRGQLLEMSLALAVSAFAAAAFQVTRSIAVLRLGGKFDGTVQAAVWDRLLALPVAFFRRFTVGDLASRSMGIDSIRELVTGNVLTALLSAVFSVFSFALLFAYSPRLAFVATGLVAVLLAVTALLVYLQLRKQRQLLHLEGRIASLLFGLINAVGKLRVAGAERRAYALWAERFAAQRQRTIEAQRFANVQAAFNAAYGVLTLAALFAMAGVSMLSTGAGLSTSDFLAFNAAFGQFQTAALSLIGLLSTVLTMVPIYERLSPILTTPPEVDATKAQAGELAGDVELGHVSFRYKTDGPLVLDDVSFRARPGELIALVGPSGSGKSTCLRLLLGFEQPAAGSIYFDGQDLPSLDVHSVRRQIGVVLQNGRPMVGSLYSNIVGEGDLGIDAAWEAARMAGLEEDIRAMPMGMHTVVSEGAGTFSGGQRQRLLIARALVHRPRILLFDEATSALDNRTQEIVSQSLARLKATRIVVAHRLSTILHADRIYVLKAGRVVEEGTYEELVARGGLFARLVERQTT
ncbi:MAG TPA: NHLP bacteriocin export ABC transporter permease/ATPase subunit [Thermoanaerobaculia bacterium]|nr:NHLP bacteriocin export ABC transporter permease/ATPase subunit [Thermoanaerobaculia bacterium]